MKAVEARGIGPADGPVADAAGAYQQMEAAFLRQLLSASGAFKPADVAGGQLRADMFIEAVADAVAKGGGLGIARMLQESMGDAGIDPGAALAGGDAMSAKLLAEAEAPDRPGSGSGLPPGPPKTAANQENVRVGQRGRATGPHPHSEGRIDGLVEVHPADSRVDPTRYAGVVHRALNAYQQRAEDTVKGNSGPLSGDGR